MLRRLTFLLIALALATLAPRAQAADSDDVLDALRLDDMLRIMRDEGLDYGREMAADMFGRTASPRWGALVEAIYDTDAMEQVVRGGFAEALPSDAVDPLLAFLTSDDGKRVIGLELSAREAMIDDDTEEAARAAFRAIDGEDDPVLAQIDRFVAANDLVEANVAGALNASFQFYRGLADGGALQMTEGDMLADVWAQEEDTREDTREWLHAFLLMAYRPLDLDTLDRYVDMTASDEGRALNAALFAAFNAMYDDISYALGLAAAEMMTAQDL